MEYKFVEARPPPVYTLGLLLAHGQSPHVLNIGKGEVSTLKTLAGSPFAMLICCLKALLSLSPAGSKDFIFLGSILQGLCSTARASPLLLCYIRLTETAQACW